MSVINVTNKRKHLVILVLASILFHAHPLPLDDFRNCVNKESDDKIIHKYGRVT